MNLIRSYSWWLVLIGFLSLFPLVYPSTSYINDTTEILIMALFGMSLHLLIGYAGLLSLGHCAFFAVGSYTTGLLLRETSLSVPLALFTGMALAGLVGLVMGYFCIRLTGFFFAFLTLAFSQIIYVIVVRWVNLTGGDQGLIGGIPKPIMHFLGWFIDISPRLNFYYFTALLVCGSLILCKIIIDSPFGWVLRCIRENPSRARFIGVNVRRYQVSIFIIAGIFGALAGGLTALNINGAYPEHAYWTRGADPIFMILIGGMKSFAGPIVGAAVLVFLNILIAPHTRFFAFFLGTVLIFFIVFARMGIVDFFVLKKEIWGKALGWGRIKILFGAK